MMKFKGHDVSEANLLPFLTPTSQGTQWYESPPDGIVTDRAIGRCLLQFHQLAEFSKAVRQRHGTLKFLDIGTGNGMLPQLVADQLGAEISVGLDPYEDGEHKTSWARKTRSKLLMGVQSRLNSGEVSFENYRDLVAYEEFYKAPQTLFLTPKTNDWIFEKQFLETYDPESVFNLLFAKCIDHIHDWESLFLAARNITEVGGTLVIKHNSFFSFNGAHRYASTFIPWGHVILSEQDYAEYVQEFHSARSEEMLNFYYEGLSYERKSLSRLIEILMSTGWKVFNVEKSQAKHAERKLALAGGATELMIKVRKKFPDVALDELLSGRIIITAEKT